VIHGPMGFDIGGDLPESVALSTLAECHQVLFKEDFRRK
jgi:xanthine dehydrogenase accessory factor